MSEHVDAARAVEVIDLADRSLAEARARRHARERRRPPAGLQHRLRRLLLDCARGMRFPRRRATATPRRSTLATAAPPGPTGRDVGRGRRRRRRITQRAGARRAALSRAARRRRATPSRWRPARRSRATPGSSRAVRSAARTTSIGRCEISSSRTLEARLLAVGSATSLTSLPQRLARDEARRADRELKAEIEREIRERLVEDRGAEALAKSVRKPLPEDLDVMHANRDEMAQFERALRPLSRKLAVRLARKRRRRRRGPVDLRHTVRRSLSTGGVPIDLRFKPPRPAKPEIFVIADISGSVASFARFTLHLVHAISSQFSKVRSFVFVDGLDEVTQPLRGRRGSGRRGGAHQRRGRRHRLRRPLRLRTGAEDLPRPLREGPHQTLDHAHPRRRAQQLPPGPRRGARATSRTAPRPSTG